MELNNTGTPIAERELLTAQVRELYGRASYTHKTHEKQADICLALYGRQRRIKVALTALSSGAFLASLSGLLLDEQWGGLTVSFIAVLLSASSLGDTTFRHGEEMQQHRDTAAKLWGVRESYLSLIVDLTADSLTVEEGRLTRDRIQDAMEEIVTEAPRTTGKAYREAQNALKNREDLTFTEREIDQLLPERLRTSQEGNSVSGQ